ncbi:MAG: T9SS type A sorting domain-containing protein [Candidatus Zixiibacteriota bacterium]
MPIPCLGKRLKFIARLVALLLTSNRTGNSAPTVVCVADPNPTYYVTHRWPTEQPSGTIGCGSFQPIVTSLLGEFRESPDHFHGGVDIAWPANWPIYSPVHGSNVYVDAVSSADNWLRTKILFPDGTIAVYRYVHIMNIQVFPNDRLVWNPSASAPYYDAYGQRCFPVHLPMCRVQDLAHDHLHFEEIWYDLYYKQWFRVNPLMSLCPWQDNDNPVIESIVPYEEYGVPIETGGDGSYDFPWIVPGNFDLRVHAHDVLPSWSGHKAGILWMTLDVRDEWSWNPVLLDIFGFYFFYLSGEQTHTESQNAAGLSNLYDVYTSTQSDYYYWATNYFRCVDPAADWAIMASDLDLDKKYSITIGCYDYDGNSTTRTVWVQRYWQSWPAPDCGAITSNCQGYSIGDINLNHVCYEIGDFIKLQNYLIYGPGVFKPGLEDCALSNSDINCDGQPGTAADLWFLLSIVTGDELPPVGPKLSPYTHSAEVTSKVESDMLRVSITSPVDLGAALFVFRGDNLPTRKPVLAVGNDGMQIRSAVHDGEFRVLISPNIVRPGTIAAGTHEVFTVPLTGTQELKLTEVQLSDTHGATVSANLPGVAPPKDFAVLQNYPNPFNAGTVIPLDLKQPSDWSVVIYNVLGQAVRALSGIGDPGRVNVTWDGRDRNGIAVPSGVYFYRASVGDYAAAREMVVLR